MTLTLEQAQAMMERNGGNLDLSGTQITTLPDNLTVGGGLDLSGTQITALPDNLTVGGWLNLSGTQISNRKAYKRLKHGDYVPGKFLYADGILTHVKSRHKVGKYTFYVGKIKGHNVISDGTNYAHCNKLRDGVADLLFKTAKDRGAEQYGDLSLDTEMTVEEMVTMYRIITGACKQGSEHFVNSLGELKEKYTIREAIDITKGQYNSTAFSNFFRGGITMHDIHIPSFIFGAFCMTCLIISYYFGKWAVGDGECGEFEEVNEE